MRKTLITIVAALACVFASAQDDAAAFKARYERQVRNVGAAGVGVETILTRWEEAFPEDPAVMEGFYKFWFAKSLGSAVVTRDTRRYLGKDPMFSLRDSTGKERFYFEDNAFVDSLFALSQTYIDRAIATEPCELSYRVDTVTSLMLYEKESPDMATQELLKLIDFQRKSHPEWTYLGNVIIGNDVEVGSNTTIDRAPMESTIIEDGARIDNLCQIAHNVVVGRNAAMAAQCGIAGSTKIGEGVILGGQVGVTGHIYIAPHTTVGAKSAVIGNVRKEGTTIYGNPAIDHKTYLKAYARFKRSAEEE